MVLRFSLTVFMLLYLAVSTANESRALLLELERNPQQYGLDIMHLQAELAGKGAKRGVSQQDLARMQANLALRLALICSLESPQGLG